MTSIVFPGTSLSSLRTDLLAHSPNEAAAVLLAAPAKNGSELRLLVRECQSVPASEYNLQEEYRVTIAPQFIARLLKAARLQGFSLILAHTHPFAQTSVHFSDVDDDGERRLMPALFARAGNRSHASIVLGTRALAARSWHDPTQPPANVQSLSEVGADVVYHVRPDLRESAMLPQFDRSIRAFGVSGQKALSTLTAAVIGVGGLGSIVAQQLAYLGVGRLILIDRDTIDVTNLNRVVGANESSIGRPKVEVSADLIRSIRPNLPIIAYRGDIVTVSSLRSLLDADFVFCCTDSHGSRAVLNQFAYQYFVPTIDMGVRIDTSHGRIQSITGRVQMLSPGLPCLVCQNLLDPEQVRRDLLTDEARAIDPYIVGSSEPVTQPAVISLNGTIASMAVTMMLSAITGIQLASRHQIVLFDRGVTRAICSSPQSDCVVCSLRGSLGRGDTWPFPGRPQ